LHCTNALQFVEKALKIYKDEIINYDEFWLVFDKDANNEDVFNQAINKAKTSKCNCAYSIQAFEIWMIHHYKIFSSPLSRHDYSKELTKLLGFEYEKDRETAKKVAQALYPKIHDALKNSEISYNQNGSKPIESSTTVFKLINSILKMVS
jgi:hypothetical protein